MLRIAADENFNNRVIRGLLRRVPEADVRPAQDHGLVGASDDAILDWAASEARVLVTHDVSTRTFVLQELRRQASFAPDPLGFFHFRDRDAFEVDIVIERGSTEVAGVEVKAAATVHQADLRGLRKLRDAAGKRFVAGVILYDGSATIRFGDGLFAVPVRKLWETT